MGGIKSDSFVYFYFLFFSNIHFISVFYPLKKQKHAPLLSRIRILKKIPFYRKMWWAVSIIAPYLLQINAEKAK